MPVFNICEKVRALLNGSGLSRHPGVLLAGIQLIQNQVADVEYQP